MNIFQPEIEEKKKKLKPVEEITACVVDYGTFISVAEKLGETVKKCYYFSPFEEEYTDLRECVKGTGLNNVKRCENFLDPDIFDDIDLFVFPDIGYGAMQRHLRSLGKAVWGSMGASELEFYRTKFLEVVKATGLQPYHRKR